MATKAHPGKYDCHAKAEPNEPLFIILGRDRFAEHLVRIWAALCAMEDVRQEKLDKISEALHCANAMQAYRKGRPYCHVCLCTEEAGCEGGCSWANKEKTVCTTPACLAAYVI